MSIDQNKTLVLRFFEELWNRRKLEVADEIFAPDCVTHQLQSGVEIIAVPRNAEAVKEHIGEWLKGFPDLNFTVEQMLAENDRVVTYATMRGTHTGVWNGISDTGKEVSIRMMIIHQIVNQKIAADWVLVESLGFFQQLGFLPTTQEIMSNAAS
ncbi:MAG: ester cyclase [Acidobacteriota bacterium]|nr:ester cyclase [Acidobacteriota bacterium]